MKLATCVICSCDDNHACDGADGPCSWALLDRARGIGVCSYCVAPALPENGDRLITVQNDWSARGKGETTAWKVNLCGARGGVHYTLLSTPRLAKNHRLQSALKRVANLAAKALQPIVATLPP